MTSMVLAYDNRFDFMVSNVTGIPWTISWKRDLLSKIHLYLMKSVNGDNQRKSLCHALNSILNERDNDCFEYICFSCFDGVYIVDSYESICNGEQLFVNGHGKNVSDCLVVDNPMWV